MIFAIVSLAATALGMGVDYYATRQRDKANAEIEERNARVREEAATNAELEAAESARRTRIQGRRDIAKMEARYAKAGFEAEGTPLLMLAEQAGLMELEAQDIFRQGGSTAMKYRTGAQADRFSAASTRRASPFRQASSLLSGTSKLTGQYSNFKKQGIFDND